MTGAGPHRAVASDRQLAQANVARLRHPVGDPRVAGFVAALDRVNHLADHAPGFVWRHVAEHGHVAVSDEDPLVVLNISVWRDYPALHAFTYRSHHGHFTRRRAEWFERLPQPSTVLWWVAAGTHPTPADALARLAHLRRHGPTPSAFSLRARFDGSGRPERRRGRLADQE
ncbi:protein of unknown function [Jatrophihabitans endophyticus]|uniref:DUF3291 domain-containing protein n=1 Tax=Jatrophihabitans endophyticus TaxID=1206085 RepID=A0A1M5C725_9ACTN|nr:DUF3291 domain-containing protein [Jatrophihabitans endophyticus]SHF50543.1 protein of unknown function [Jatrophihabitans endophyticus]